MSFVRLPGPAINVMRVRYRNCLLTCDTNKNPNSVRTVPNAKQCARLETTDLAGFAAGSDGRTRHGLSMAVSRSQIQDGSSSGRLEFRTARVQDGSSSGQLEFRTARRCLFRNLSPPREASTSIRQVNRPGFKFERLEIPFEQITVTRAFSALFPQFL
jgi:hypothetical protein